MVLLPGFYDKTGAGGMLHACIECIQQKTKWIYQQIIKGKDYKKQPGCRE
jgi:hypothetical protein